MLAARVAAVRRHRAASRRAGTRRRAAAPALFGEIRQPVSRYLCIPRHGAEGRRVAPMAFAGPEAVAHDSTLTVAGAGLDHFGILQSAMFTAWLRAVGGRIKGDPRISAELVYNTFPWPEPGARGAVERAARGVLAARARHAPRPLGRLYDPAAMPAGLAEAHDALDAAVDALFAPSPLDDAARLALLLARYARLAGWARPPGSPPPGVSGPAGRGRRRRRPLPSAAVLYPRFFALVLARLDAERAHGLAAAALRLLAAVPGAAALLRARPTRACGSTRSGWPSPARSASPPAWTRTRPGSRASARSASASWRSARSPPGRRPATRGRASIASSPTAAC